MNLYKKAFLNIKKYPRTFWIVIFATLINQIGNMAFVFLMLYATQYLGFTLLQGASAFATVSVSMFLSGVFAGNMIDHLGAGRMMIGSVLMNGLILISFPMLHSFYAVVFSCLLWGFVYGVYRPASQTLISYLSATGMHKITFSINRLAINLGMSIGPAMGGYLAVHSFPAVFISNGVANIFAGVILFFGLSGSLYMAHRSSVEQKKIFSISLLKHDPTLLWFLMGMIPISMVFFQHESTLPVYLKQNLGFPISFYGWLFTINTVLIVCFELLLNVATLNWPYRVNFILGSLFIALGFFGIYFASSIWHMVILGIFWTIGEMILYPSASSYIAEIAPEERRGSYMSLFNASSNLGLLLGPLGGSFIMQQVGGPALWAACGIFGVISIVIFSSLKESKRKIQNG